MEKQQQNSHDLHPPNEDEQHQLLVPLKTTAQQSKFVAFVPATVQEAIIKVH